MRDNKLWEEGEIDWPEEGNPWDKTEPVSDVKPSDDFSWFTDAMGREMRQMEINFVKRRKRWEKNRKRAQAASKARRVNRR